jgi:hypothetical protein
MHFDENGAETLAALLLQSECLLQLFFVDQAFLNEGVAKSQLLGKNRGSRRRFGCGCRLAWRWPSSRCRGLCSSGGDPSGALVRQEEFDSFLQFLPYFFTRNNASIYLAKASNFEVTRQKCTFLSPVRALSAQLTA